MPRVTVSQMKDKLQSAERRLSFTRGQLEIYELAHRRLLNDMRSAQVEILHRLDSILAKLEKGPSNA